MRVSKRTLRRRTSSAVACQHIHANRRIYHAATILNEDYAVPVNQILYRFPRLPYGTDHEKNLKISGPRERYTEC